MKFLLNKTLTMNSIEESQRFSSGKENIQMGKNSNILTY